jgi:hypothetical protein
MTTTIDAPKAQARSRRRIRFNVKPPVDPTTRRIKVARAVALVARTKCPANVAARAVGLDRDHKAAQDIRELCDFRQIPRRDRLGMPLVVPATLEPATGYVPPRRISASTQYSLADMFAELREVADPLAPEMMRQPDISEDTPKKSTITIRCKECNGRFEAKNFGAKFCSVKCRVRAWRV